MSRDIRVQFEVRDMLVMKNTLKQMGYDCRELGSNKIAANKMGSFLGGGITIDGNAGEIIAAHGNVREVDEIKQAYTTELYRDRAIQEGMQVHEETNAEGEIILWFSH